MEPARSCDCATNGRGDPRGACSCGCCTCVDDGGVRSADPVQLRLVPPTKEDPQLGPRRLEALGKLVVAGLLFALVPLALLVWVARGSHFGPTASVGLRAPSFALPRIGQEGTYGSADLAGAPAVVVFWSPGCRECVEELRRLQLAADNRGINALGVQVGAITDAPDTATLEANGIRFPNVIDASGVVAGSFGLMGVPEAHFVDSAWRVRAVDRGDRVTVVDERRGLVNWSPIPADVLDRRIDDLLGTSPKRTA